MTELKAAKVGVTPEKLNPKDVPFKYLERFELAGIANGWTGANKVLQLPNYLTSSGR